MAQSWPDPGQPFSSASAHVRAERRLRAAAAARTATLDRVEVAGGAERIEVVYGRESVPITARIRSSRTRARSVGSIHNTVLNCLVSNFS